ncbi:head-tail connector protein [Breoghania sp. L-A4]|uniref:head-tail connector protein n=1 Tax=Breoghania sp. L-A4 TaxID=2304600 RepID=UPI000E35E825|nr:head-tail connector protein [Breoghania sp. L-A4]AXS39961.1 hypothetical protein D1F64_07675 [Breoghania sp. L-A4]
MASILISPPAAEPLTLEEAKLFLRLDSSDEDALVSALIAAARGHVEAATGRALIHQGWRVFRDGWPSRRIVRLPRAPLASVDAVTVYDADGAAELLDAALYSADGATAPARLVVSDEAPEPGLSVNGVAIDITAGYGASAADVPQPLRLAVRRLVAHWYERRETEGSIPPNVAALLAPYRIVSL